jgi:hypothetical protein
VPITREDAVDLIRLLAVDQALRHDLQFVLVTPDLEAMLEPVVAAQLRSQVAIDALAESGRGDAAGSAGDRRRLPATGRCRAPARHTGMRRLRSAPQER